MFRPYGIVGKYFVSENNVCWNIMIVPQEFLKGDNHWVSKISEVCVIFHFLCKNIAWVDYTRNVFNVNIFRLMAFSKLYSIGCLDAWCLLNLLKPPIGRRPCCSYKSWSDSMPLESQYCLHGVWVIGVLWRTCWFPWFLLNRNLKLSGFDGWISMQ